MTQPSRRRGGAFSAAFGSALSAKAEAPEAKTDGKADKEETSIGKAVEEAAEVKKTNGKAVDEAPKEKKKVEEAHEKKAERGAAEEKPLDAKPPAEEPKPARAEEKREADQTEEEEEQERLFEAQHGFAGAVFGAALLKDFGDSAVNDMLDRLGKVVPPPPPNAAYTVGQKAEVIGTIMRTGESLESPKICRLEPGTQIEVVEIGKGTTGKRIKVMVLTGLAARGMAGWISVVSGEGVALLNPIGAGGGGAGFIGDLIGSIAADAEDVPVKKGEEPSGSGGGGPAVESIDALLGRVDLDLAAAAEKQEEAPPAAAPAKPARRRSAFAQYTQ